MIEKEYVGIRKREEFDKISTQVESYLGDWHCSFIGTSYGEYQRLYFKTGVCVADSSYWESFHPEERPEPKAIFLFRIIADEAEKIEPVRKDLNKIVRTLIEDMVVNPEYHKRKKGRF